MPLTEADRAKGIVTTTPDDSFKYWSEFVEYLISELMLKTESTTLLAPLVVNECGVFANV